MQRDSFLKWWSSFRLHQLAQHQCVQILHCRVSSRVQFQGSHWQSEMHSVAGWWLWIHFWRMGWFSFHVETPYRLKCSSRWTTKGGKSCLWVQTEECELLLRGKQTWFKDYDIRSWNRQVNQRDWKRSWKIPQIWSWCKHFSDHFDAWSKNILRWYSWRWQTWINLSFEISMGKDIWSVSSQLAGWKTKNFIRQLSTVFSWTRWSFLCVRYQRQRSKGKEREGQHSNHVFWGNLDSKGRKRQVLSWHWTLEGQYWATENQ